VLLSALSNVMLRPLADELGPADALGSQTDRPPSRAVQHTLYNTGDSVPCAFAASAIGKLGLVSLQSARVACSPHVARTAVLGS